MLTGTLVYAALISLFEKEHLAEIKEYLVKS
jgi:hypothetical protein